MIRRTGPFWSVAFFVAVWQAAGVGGVLPRGISTPMDVLKCAADAAREGFLWRDLAASLHRLIPGILIGCAAGMCCGLLTGRVRFAALALGPLLHGWRALPAVALAPFWVLVLGINDWPSKITIIATGAFFPVWLNTHVGASLVSRTYLELAQSLELSRWRRFVEIVVPATLVFTLTGIRTGLAAAYVMLFISEWIGANGGIGYRLSIAYIVGNVDLMMLGLAQLGLLAYLSDLAFDFGTRLAFPWLERTDG